MSTRALAALLALGASGSGCAEDRCSMGEADRLLLVHPREDPPSDTTNPHVFLSIQDALDAAPPTETDSIETTICVADGVYREQVAIPPGVHLAGRGADRVRLRPPGGRADETLVRVPSNPLTRTAITGFDLGGTSGICIDFTGGGHLEVLESRVLDCGTALRGVGGGDAGTVLVRNTPMARNGLVLEATDMREVAFVSTDITGNTDLVQARGTGDPDAAGADEGSLGVAFVGVTFAENAGAVVVSDSRLTLMDVESKAAEVARPDEPLLVLQASSAHLSRVHVRDVDARPLLSADGGHVEVESTGWDGTDGSGGTAPVMTLTGDATLEAVHLTVLGESPAIQAEADTRATVVNSIVWGQADAFGGEGTFDVRSSLLGDLDVPRPDWNLSEDPELDGWTPAETSPVRCAGDPDALPDDPRDLRGGDRPFLEGKVPDIGAVERQVGCP